MQTKKANLLHCLTIIQIMPNNSQPQDSPKDRMVRDLMHGIKDEFARECDFYDMTEANNGNDTHTQDPNTQKRPYIPPSQRTPTPIFTRMVNRSVAATRVSAARAAAARVIATEEIGRASCRERVLDGV